METLKKPEEVLQPDLRNLCWASLKTGHAVTFSDRYSAIAGVQLGAAVPDAIRSYFATIQNLCVYGWFAYDLYSVVALMSYAMIEMALRARLPVNGKDRRSFKELLKKAVEDGLVREKSFSRARMLRQRRAEGLRMNRELARLVGKAYRLRTTRDEYLAVICETLPKLRNALAHPSGNAVHMPGEALSKMIFAAEFANQLFSR